MVTWANDEGSCNSSPPSSFGSTNAYLDRVTKTSVFWLLRKWCPEYGKTMFSLGRTIMCGFYFNTENNQYFYDALTGIVSRSSTTLNNSEPFIFGNKPSVLSVNDKREEFLNGLQSTHLVLMVTEECNLRCRYCAYSGIYENQRVHSHNIMSKEIAKKAIDLYFDHFWKVKQNNVAANPSIGFYGGEPMMNFELIKFAIEYANSFYTGEINYTITLNATLLTEERMDYLVENDVNMVFSLNGDKEENDRSRVFPDGEGTYDIIMKNVNHLRTRHPEYYQRNFAISAVFDSGTDIISIDSFFSQEKFADVPISPSMVSKAYGNWYDQFDAESKRRFSEQLKFLKEKFYTAKKSNISSSYFIRGLFNSMLLTILTRRIGGNSPSFVPFTRPCVPGVKIAVDYLGKLHVCEKVNFSRPIGDVTTGIDVNRVNDMLDTYINALADKCTNCPVSRLCSVCYKDVFDGEGVAHAQAEEWCTEYAKLVKETFEIVYTLLESGITDSQLIGTKK
jgi:uncharacterized protein